MSFADGATLHDLLRHIIRSFHWPDEESQRDALLIVEGNEAGYETLGEYRAELKARADAARQEQTAPGEETPAQAIARLQAENLRLRQQAIAAAPAPTSPVVG